MWSHMVWVGFLSLSLFVPFSAGAKKPQKIISTSVSSIMNVSGLSRSKAIAYAYTHNPKLLTFRARLRQAIARLKGSRVYPNNPTLSASGGVQLQDPGTPPILPRVSANLSLALPVGGRWGKKQQWAKAQLQRVKAEWKLRKFQLAIRIHRAWNKMVVAQKQYQLQQNIVAFLQRLTNLARSRLKQGAGNQLELQLALASELRATQAKYNAAALFRQ